MRKLLYILAFVCFTQMGSAQVYELGLTYNMGQILGENNSNFSVLDQNFGITLKKNMHPRMSYRLSANKLTTQSSKLTEFAFGIDFNFKNYNLLRANGKDRSAPYVILEVASILYDNGINSNKFAFALPLGVGYKTSITDHFIFAVEAKARIAFTDALDSGITENFNETIFVNNNTLDAYYYTGFTFFYTFGWPRGSKNQTRF